MLVVAKSDIGLVRQTNEDSYGYLSPNLFIVADGMGGHLAGEIASKLAVAVVMDYINMHDKEYDENYEEMLSTAIVKANKEIFEKAQGTKQYAGMGTTLTVVYCKDERFFLGHVGDSRVYLLRDSQLQRLTTDHSLVEGLVKNGSITEEEARIHPQRNILTRAVGVDKSVDVDTSSSTFMTKDKILLCTDGLTNMLTDDLILKLLLNDNEDIQNKVNHLIQNAIHVGGLDNITAILIEN